MKRTARVMLLSAPLLLADFVLLSSADAATYRYVDKNGTMNFTDCYECIPKEYRNQVKKMREEAAPPVEKAKEAASAGKEAPKKKEAAKADREKEEQAKKQKAREAKEKRIEELRKQIEAKEEEKAGLRTSPVFVYDRYAANRLDQEIAGLQKQIQEIQEQLAGE